MPSAEDCKTVLGKSVAVVWLNMKGEYTAARLTPNHSEQVLNRLFSQTDSPSRTTSEHEPLAALAALIEWQAKEIREST